MMPEAGRYVVYMRALLALKLYGMEAQDPNRFERRRCRPDRRLVGNRRQGLTTRRHWTRRKENLT